MVYGESKSRFELPTSVHSMMELILGVATSFFIKESLLQKATTKVKKGPIDVFRESIRDVVCGTSET